MRVRRVREGRLPTPDSGEGKATGIPVRELRMRVLFVVPMLVACAHIAGNTPVTDLRTQYEVAMTIPDVEAPLPPEYSGSMPPCVAKSDAPLTGNACMEDQVSTDEANAFQTEATRLASHVEENCRRLGDAIENHLFGVRMYDRA